MRMQSYSLSTNRRGGYALLTSVLFFLFATSIIVLGTSSSVLREMQVASNLLKTKASYFASESGSEDVIYRKKNGVPVSTSETLSLDGYPVTTTIGTNAGGDTTVLSQSDRLGYTRKVSAVLTQGAGAGFFYGIQVGAGGLTLQNSASVVGNVYSNGLVTGFSSVSSNPSNPTYISQVTVGPTANRAALGVGYAYVVTDLTIQTVNLSNPALPTVVSTLNTGGQQKDIALANGHIFVTSSNGNSVKAYSLNNPSTPSFVGTVSVTGANQIQASGSYVYVLATGSTLQTINISNPSAMSVVSSLTTVSSSPIGLAIQGEYLYVISQGGPSKLAIYSLANPASPTLVGSITINYANPLALTVAGSYAYVDVYGCGCIYVINISNPSAPTIVTNTTVNSVNNGYGLYASGSYLYVAVNYSTNRQFQIWDISNPSALVNINTINIATGSPVQVIGGQTGYIYLLTQVMNGTSPLRIYQVTGSGGSMIYGDVVSAGPTGSINQINATSSLYARTITNSLAGRNAYYKTISNTTVLGLSYPNSTDQPTSTMPISDEQISAWEAEALAGGTAVCDGDTYKISTFVRMGPKKIPCDLEVEGGGTLSLTGVVWVSGNILLQNTSYINVDSSLSGRAVPLIADPVSNRATGGTIVLKNSSQVHGSGNNSYVLFISQNNSAENGGSENAISVNNTFTGDAILFAPHGLINLDNSIALKEVTAYKVLARNTAQVIYTSGLANLIFSSGPTGGYSIGGWGASQ